MRELENVLDRAALLAADSGLIDEVRLLGTTPEVQRRLSVGREEFLAAWERSGGDATETARLLSVTRRSVFRLKSRFLGGADAGP